jgi:hypothetical protein
MKRVCDGISAYLYNTVMYWHGVLHSQFFARVSFLIPRAAAQVSFLKESRFSQCIFMKSLRCVMSEPGGIW